MAEIEDQEDGKSDVSSNKVLDVPVTSEEDGEAIGESEKGDDGHNEPGSIRLERGLVRQSLKHVVEDHGLAEADVGDENNNPGNVARDGADVHEPVEDSSTRVGDVEEGEETERPGEEDSGPGDTLLIGFAEYLGGLVVEGHGVENTAAGVEERVTSRPGRGQDSGVDDVIEDRDADVLDTCYSC